MSTMVVEVSPEQEKALEGLFQCMEVSYQTITPKGDFWDELSANSKTVSKKDLLCSISVFVFHENAIHSSVIPKESANVEAKKNTAI